MVARQVLAWWWNQGGKSGQKVARLAFEVSSASLRTYCVPVDGDGMRVDLLERALSEDRLRRAFAFVFAFTGPTRAAIPLRIGPGSA